MNFSGIQENKILNTEIKNDNKLIVKKLDDTPSKLFKKNRDWRINCFITLSF